MTSIQQSQADELHDEAVAAGIFNNVEAAMADDDVLDRAEFAEMCELARRMRRIAGPVGPLHSFWDDISEAEARCGFARHRPMLRMSNREFIDHMKTALDQAARMLMLGGQPLR